MIQNMAKKDLVQRLVEREREKNLHLCNNTHAFFFICLTSCIKTHECNIENVITQSYHEINNSVLKFSE